MKVTVVNISNAQYNNAFTLKYSQNHGKNNTSARSVQAYTMQSMATASMPVDRMVRFGNSALISALSHSKKAFKYYWDKDEEVKGIQFKATVDKTTYTSQVFPLPTYNLQDAPILFICSTNHEPDKKCVGIISPQGEIYNDADDMAKSNKPWMVWDHTVAEMIQAWCSTGMKEWYANNLPDKELAKILSAQAPVTPLKLDAIPKQLHSLVPAPPLLADSLRHFTDTLTTNISPEHIGIHWRTHKDPPTFCAVYRPLDSHSQKRRGNNSHHSNLHNYYVLLEDPTIIGEGPRLFALVTSNGKISMARSVSVTGQLENMTPDAGKKFVTSLLNTAIQKVMAPNLMKDYASINYGEVPTLSECRP